MEDPRLSDMKVLLVDELVNVEYKLPEPVCELVEKVVDVYAVLEPIGCREVGNVSEEDAVFVPIVLS